jgi:hypothetical protein
MDSGNLKLTRCRDCIRFESASFFFIVIPGTIIGDCFLHNDWTQIEMEPFKIHRFHDRVLVIGLLALIIIPAILIGLKYRLVVETTLFAVAILAIANYVFHHLNTNIEKFLRKLFRWGSYWLIIGLISEPYEGGIKRISPTLSYFLITGSLANFLLIATVISLTFSINITWSSQSVITAAIHC